MDQAQAVCSSWSLDWDGREYKFAELTDGVKGDYTAWLTSQAQGAPYRMQPDLIKKDGSIDSNRFAETKAQITNNVTSLQYDWGGPLSSQSLGTLPGMVRLLYLLHQASDKPEADEDEIEAMVMAKMQIDREKGVPDEEGEVPSTIKRLMETSVPKSRGAFIAKKAERLAEAKRQAEIERERERLKKQ